MRERCDTTEGTVAALVAAERLLAYVVSAADRDDEDWMLKLDSAVQHIDETQWLHWTGRVAERICWYHYREGRGTMSVSPGWRSRVCWRSVAYRRRR